MKRIIPLVVVCVCLSAAHAQLACAAAPGQAAGRITDSGGLALGGAAVKFDARFRGMRITVFTQADGAFTAELPAGAYRVTAELRGYLDQTREGFEIIAAQSTEMNMALDLARNGFDLESQISGAELLSLLPPDARQTLINTCAGGCHSLGAVGGKRMTLSGWTRLLERMSTHGSGRGGPADLARNAAILTEYFGSGQPSYKFAFFPLTNTVDHLSKVVIREIDLPRRETQPHDMVVDASGRRIWYGDSASGDVLKTGLWGWIDPETGAFKEYQIAGCVGTGKPLADSDGSVWMGCGKTWARWDPDTDEQTLYPVDAPHGAIGLGTLDSQGNLYTPVPYWGSDPQGSDYIAGYNPRTKESTLWEVPTRRSMPYEVLADSRDILWFTEFTADKLAKLDPKTGKITEYPVPTKNSQPRRFAIDSNDNIWFAEWTGNKLGRLEAQTGKITEYELPNPYSLPYAVAIDRNDIVYFIEFGANRLARFDPQTKTLREYPIPSVISGVKKMDFTYSDDGQVTVWGSYRAGEKIVGFDIPDE